MDRRRLLILGFLPFLLAAQGGPVYTSVPTDPVAGGACAGSRVQIEADSGTCWRCSSSTWQLCAVSEQPVTATGSTTARSLKTRFADGVNVKDYGAVGNGVTDDTAAIQAAHDALPATDGTLVLPAGSNYKITGAILVTKARTRIIGHGAKITQSGTLAQGLNIAAAGVEVHGLWLYNSRGGSDWSAAGSTNAIGINLITADYAKIVGCRIENWGSTSIRVTSGKGVEISGNTIIGIGAAGGLVAGSNYNIGIEAYASGAGDEGLRVHHNYLTDLAQGIVGGYDWADVVIAGNIITGIVGQHGIYLDNTSNLAITGNAISSTGLAGIKVQMTSLATSDSRSISITGNTTRSTGDRGILIQPSAGSLTYYFVGVSIVGNSVYGATADGIYVDHLDAFAIEGNTVISSGNAGIRTGTETRSGIVASNYVKESTWSGLYLAATSGYRSVVEGNYLQNCVTADNSDAAKDSSVYLSTGTYVFRRNTIAHSSVPVGYDNTILGFNSTLSIYENIVEVSGKTVSLASATAVNTTGPGSVSADRGDTSQTLTVGTDAQVQRWATALGQNRTVTLATTQAVKGDTFRVVRTGLGAFTLDVGGLKTIASATAAFVDVTYDGSAWILTGYGVL